MAAKTPSAVRLESEGDLLHVFFTLSAVGNNDTVDLSAYFGTVIGISLTPSTAAGSTGATISGATVTFLVASGTPNLLCEAYG